MKCHLRLRMAGEEPSRSEEYSHFAAVVHTFESYEALALAQIRLQQRHFQALCPQHQLWVPLWRVKFEALTAAVSLNAELLSRIGSPDALFANEDMRRALEHPPAHRPRPADFEKVKSTIRQLVRDWSSEGQAERDACYGPIISTLLNKFPNITQDRNSVRVLCPGSGLGRLVFELARLGFASQGNEFSYFMLLTSNFILNKVDRVESIEIAPHIHQFSNVVNVSDQLRRVLLPDVNPREALTPGADFSMCAGDFVEVYGQQTGEWDAVATCFFLDTAKNVVEYIALIHKILKPGGVWVNFGPLLYHWSDVEGELSIELSYQELREVMKAVGFTIETEDQRQSVYTSNRLSMMQVVFNCAFFVAIKPSEV